MSEVAIVSKIHTLYPDAAIDIDGEGCNFELFVISNGFQDMAVVKRQQSLLNLFSEELVSGKLHALSVKAKTFAEMEANRSHLVQLEM